MFKHVGHYKWITATAGKTFFSYTGREVFADEKHEAESRHRKTVGMKLVDSIAGPCAVRADCHSLKDQVLRTILDIGKDPAKRLVTDLVTCSRSARQIFEAALPMPF